MKLRMVWQQNVSKAFQERYDTVKPTSCCSMFQHGPCSTDVGVFSSNGMEKRSIKGEVSPFSPPLSPKPNHIKVETLSLSFIQMMWLADDNPCWFSTLKNWTRLGVFDLQFPVCLAGVVTGDDMFYCLIFLLDVLVSFLNVPPLKTLSFMCMFGLRDCNNVFVTANDGCLAIPI